MIGIFGGTFDPVHFGHLRLALELLQQRHFKEIRFMPCREPVHKSPALATVEQRIKMLQLAIADQPGFVLDQREILRSTPSYTLETVLTLRQDFPDQPLGLIIGSDAAGQFTQWYRWQEILAHVQLIVIPRENAMQNALPPEIRDHIIWQPLQTLPIASHTIREEIKAKRSVKYWVPDTVWDYIMHQQLYR